MVLQLEEQTDMKNYKQKEIIAALGIRESKFHEWREKYKIFQGGVKEGRFLLYSSEDLTRFQQELATVQEERQNTVQEEVLPSEPEVVTLSSTIPLLIQEMHFTAPTTSEIVPAATMIDPIAYTIELIKNSQKAQDERDSILYALKLYRDKLAGDLADLDALIQRYQ